MTNICACIPNGVSSFFRARNGININSIVQAFGEEDLREKERDGGRSILREKELYGSGVYGTL